MLTPWSKMLTFGEQIVAAGCRRMELHFQWCPSAGYRTGRSFRKSAPRRGDFVGAKRERTGYNSERGRYSFTSTKPERERFDTGFKPMFSSRFSGPGSRAGPEGDENRVSRGYSAERNRSSFNSPRRPGARYDSDGFPRSSGRHPDSSNMGYREREVNTGFKGYGERNRFPSSSPRRERPRHDTDNYQRVPGRYPDPSSRAYSEQDADAEQDVDAAPWERDVFVDRRDKYIVSDRHPDDVVPSVRGGWRKGPKQSVKRPQDRKPGPNIGAENNSSNGRHRGESGARNFEHSRADRLRDVRINVGDQRQATKNSSFSRTVVDEEAEESIPVVSSRLSALKSGWTGDVLYGVSPVLAALQSQRRQLNALYVQQGLANRKDRGALDAILAASKKLGVPVHTESKHDLNMLSGNRPHQGVVLDCSALQFEEMDELPAADSYPEGQAPPVWLALDELTDPQNLGAAVRSAYFLGAAGVLTCARNSAPLSGVVSKASAGALELLPLHSARNLPRTLTMAAAQGWRVVGGDAGQGSALVSSFTVRSPTVLVMGGEGAGLRTNTRRACDTLLRIDGAVAPAGDRGAVDSLNVSVATGILLHHLVSSSRDTASATSSEALVHDGKSEGAAPRLSVALEAIAAQGGATDAGRELLPEVGDGAADALEIVAAQGSSPDAGHKHLVATGMSGSGDVGLADVEDGRMALHG